MATIHSLASETLSAIFEYAHDPRKPSTMCSAALVCRAWRAPAQRVLFLDIAVDASVPENQGAKLFIYLNSRVHTPHRVTLHVARYLARMMKRPESPRAMVPVFYGSNVLFWCTGVRKLVLDGVLVTANTFCDVNLQDLETVELGIPLKHSMVPITTSFAWPSNLQSISAHSILMLAYILDGFQSITTLRRLHFSINPSSKLDVLQITNLKRIPPSLDHCTLTLHFDARCRINQSDVQPIFEHLSMLTHLEVVPLHFVDTCNLPLVEILRFLLGILPAAVKRLSLAVVGASPSAYFHLPLDTTPFPEILELVSATNLPNLARLDFPDCKRATLEAEPAAADILTECERRAIRVVCWEDLL